MIGWRIVLFRYLQVFIEHLYSVLCTVNYFDFKATCQYVFLFGTNTFMGFVLAFRLIAKLFVGLQSFREFKILAHSGTCHKFCTYRSPNYLRDLIAEKKFKLLCLKMAPNCKIYIYVATSGKPGLRPPPGATPSPVAPSPAPRVGVPGGPLPWRRRRFLLPLFRLRSTSAASCSPGPKCGIVTLQCQG